MSERRATARQEQSPAPEPSGQAQAPESLGDWFEVPAAILCAVCGQADCDGCLGVPADDGGSGVVAIVPWERPGDAGGWSRLWATARATTQDAGVFFRALPTGPVAPALRFALLAEALAVGSMAFALILGTALAFPTLALRIGLDPELRGEVARWLFVVVPAVTLWMVAVHAVHGAAVDRGAVKQGARGQRRRAIRFGLYASGWDLMTSPLGAGVTLLSQGVGQTFRLLGLAMQVPSTAATALLRGVYGLEAEAAARANRSAILAASLAVLVTALSVGAGYWLIVGIG